MSETRSNHLEELNSSHYYEIEESQSNITKWNIIDETGQKIGTVRDLLFDKDDEKVRYIVTNLKDGILEEDRPILIPIGRARLNRDDKRVVIPQVTRGDLARLPYYKSTEDITVEDERAIREVFASEGASKETGAYDKTTFYKHEDFDEDRFYEAGEAEGPADKFSGEGVKSGKGAERKPMSRIKRREVDRTVEEKVEENFEAKRTSSRNAEGKNQENEDKYILREGETPEGGGSRKDVRVVEKVSGDNKGTNADTSRNKTKENSNNSLDKANSPNKGRDVDVENAENNRRDRNN